MKILVANHSLKQAGGTETFTYTLIGELKKRKHEIEYFCFEKGEYSDRIEQDYGISFKRSEKYDLILANHHTTVKALRKTGFIVQTCHGIFPALEQPSKFADGLVSISQEVQYHLLRKGFKSLIIHNGVDCTRYKPIKPLRETQPKVLSLCHSEDAHKIVQQACKSLNLGFSILDKYIDKAWAVEKIINEHDIVVGLGRSAYEALACGRPVIIFDKRKYGIGQGDGYFLYNILEGLKHNCSGRSLRIEFTQENLIKELIKYNPKHGQIARDYALQTFNITKTTDEYFEFLYYLSQDIHRKSFKARFLRLIRLVLILLPEQIKSPLRKIDKSLGGRFLKIKRSFIPR